MSSAVSVSASKVQEVLAGVSQGQFTSQNLQTATTQKVQEVVKTVAVNDQAVRDALSSSAVELKGATLSPEDVFGKGSEILKKLRCLPTEGSLAQMAALQSSITVTNLQIQSQIKSTRQLLSKLQPLVQQELATALTNTQSAMTLMSMSQNLPSPPES